MLAVGQTVIWAATFYLFPAMVTQFETGTGWSRFDLTVAYTGALLFAAVSSVPVGRLIDRGYGPRVMILGHGLAIALLISLANANSVQTFQITFLALGVTFATNLYEPCFAILTRTLDRRAQGAITRVTLVAGFAGTLAFLGAGWFATLFDWRDTVLTFAALVALIALPCQLIGLRLLAKRSVQIEPLSADESAHIKLPALSRRERLILALIALTFTIIATVHTMVLTHWLPFMAERGVMEWLAVAAAASIGAMQVLGRIAMLLAGDRSTPLLNARACVTGIAVATAFLLYAGANPLLIFAYAALQGSCYGISSIVRPVLTRNLLGLQGFGERSGLISGFVLVGSAIAPTLGTLLWQLGGYQLMLVVAFGLTLVAVAAVLGVGRMTHEA